MGPFFDLDQIKDLFAVLPAVTPSLDLTRFAQGAWKNPERVNWEVENHLVEGETSSGKNQVGSG